MHSKTKTLNLEEQPSKKNIWKFDQKALDLSLNTLKVTLETIRLRTNNAYDKTNEFILLRDFTIEWDITDELNPKYYVSFAQQFSHKRDIERLQDVRFIDFLTEELQHIFEKFFVNPSVYFPDEPDNWEDDLEEIDEMIRKGFA